MIETLHYISQADQDGKHLTAIQNALEAGCTWIQLRVKDEPPSRVLAYAIEAVELCKAHQAKLIVNDHPEIALKAGAYGVHLGLEDMSIVQARAIVGDQMIIGGTANTFAQIQQRFDEGVNYVGLGPYRFTTTKKKLSPIIGLQGLSDIAEQAKRACIHLPIIAIGGIQIEDVPLIMQTGVYGVAMSAAITNAADRAATVRATYEHLKMNKSLLNVNR